MKKKEKNKSKVGGKKVELIKPVSVDRLKTVSITRENKIEQLREENKLLKEVIGIVSDQDLLKKLEKGIEDIQEGRTISENEFKKKYG